MKSGLYTTIIGIAIISFSAAIIYQGKATPMDMSGWFAFGCLMLRANDTLIGLEKKNDPEQNENYF